MPKKGESRLSPQEWHEVVRRYEKGETAKQIAGDYSITDSGVLAHLRSRSLTRTKSEAGRAWRSCELQLISRERWHELYWSEESGLPSTRQLGQRFGVHRDTIARYLRLNGVSVRTRAEQVAIERKIGRMKTRQPRQGPGFFYPGHQFSPSKMPKQVGDKLRSYHAEKRAVLVCGWCGAARMGPKYRAGRFHCSKSCAGRHIALRRYHPDTPRPLIVDRLWQLTEERLKPLRERDRQGVLLANSYEQIEKVGAEIGARELEILAVMEKQGLFG